MDKHDLVYRKHSAKEHLVLAVMIVLAFFILTSNYNPEILPSGSPTGAAVVTVFGPIAVWGIIMLLLVFGIIFGIVLWWRNHKKIQIQRVLQQDVESIIKAAGKSSRPSAAVDPLARKLTKVERELVDIPLRSATSGHIIQNFPADYRKTPAKSASSLRHLLPRKTASPKKAAAPHRAKHRQSLQEKMVQIQKEISKVKIRE